MKLLKGTKIYSILTGRCPVCHRGSMYIESNPYKIKQVFKMYERCSHCNTKYKMEPSFFYGSMYASYAVGVAIAVAIFIILYFFFGVGPLGAFLGITTGLILLYPVIIRLARNIWINVFFNYDPSKIKKSD